MNLTTIKSPGVYIDEINAFAHAMPAIPTAIPAFIGYTPQASSKGVSYLNSPTKITSFAEFKAIFCIPDSPATQETFKQYNPQYYLVKSAKAPTSGNYMVIEGQYYSILPDPNTIYYLYNSMRLFYENGGGDAYVVSVGIYGNPSGKPIDSEKQEVNPNVKLEELIGGLQTLQNASEPTMYICPEATLLSVEDNGILMQKMLTQSSELRTAISIFDIIGAKNPDSILWEKDIETFRKYTGTKGLDYGVAYYPFVGTSIVQANEIDYTNLFGGDLSQLETLLNPPNNFNSQIADVVAQIKQLPKHSAAAIHYHELLMKMSPVYSQLIRRVQSEVNLLPPSGGIAGIITSVDQQIGPWKAPANISMSGVYSLPIQLSSSQQENLNVDAVTGKSVNAIQFFNGMGVLVWGARTLDGNSMDWKYVSIRRTVIFIEQSCKQAARAYVFAPNDSNTWENVKAMIANFLTSLWKQGGLVGPTAAEAFSVDCGLGTTMTAIHIEQGIMNVTVKVAVQYPAEFIVITFQQQQAISA